MEKKVEKTEEEKKKQRILSLEHTISVYEKEVLADARAKIDATRSKIDLMHGIVLGLVFGIFGNLVAQYFYSVLESLVMWRIDRLFYVNAGIFLASVVIVAFAAYYFKRRISSEEKWMWSMREGEINLVRRTEELRVGLEALRLGLVPKEES